MKKLLSLVLPAILLLVGLPLCFYLLTGAVGGRAGRESLVLAEESVRRAAIQCYALEGAYPQTVDYLEDHYGVAVDPDRFRIDYFYIGSNLMPDIHVISLDP